MRQRSPLLATAMIADTLGGLGELLARRWVEQIKSRSYLRTLLEIGFFVFGTLAIPAVIMLASPEPRATKSAPSFQEQIAALDATQASLNRLSEFIRLQRDQVITDQHVLAQLQEQRRSLEPLVSADHRTVNALLRVQEERMRDAARRERWIGFGIGIISSIVGSALLTLAALLLRRIARQRRRPEV